MHRGGAPVSSRARDSPRGPLPMFFRVNSDVECLRKPAPDTGSECSASRHPRFPAPGRVVGGSLQYEPVDRIERRPGPDRGLRRT
ncbi:hypothetical protein EAO73_34385 [Streptomyces sp. col6]|nr:hypothetical protein EAO73_34385 [Streptomyces sp. col6]